MRTLRGWALTPLAGGSWAHSHLMGIHRDGAASTVPLVDVRRIVFRGPGGGGVLAL